MAEMGKLLWLACHSASLLLHVMLFLAQASAQEAALLVSRDSFNSQIDLTAHTLYFEDLTGTVTLERAIALDKWRPLAGEDPHFGFTSSVFWFKVALRNPDSQSVSKLLHIKFSHLDRVRVVLVNAEGVVGDHLLGDTFAFDQRPIKHRELLVPIDLAHHSDMTIYLQVDTDSAMQVPLTLWDPAHFIEQDQYHLISQAFILGLLFVMGIYNLLLYHSFRDKSYILLFFSVLFMALLEVAASGFGYQYLWPTLPGFKHYAPKLFGDLACISTLCFAISFLNLKSVSPITGVILKLVIGVNILHICSLYFLPTSLSNKIALLMLSASALVCICAGFRAWYVGYVPARFFTLAFIAIPVELVILNLAKFNLIPPSISIVETLYNGPVVMVLLLALALNYRIALLRREKEAAEQEVVLRLESKVAERTAELSATLEKFAHLNDQLARQSREDGLTGALNRRAFDECLDNEWQRANRNKSALSLILCDIDHFKSFNDNYGHIAGDNTLRCVSHRLQASVKRPPDAVFRYGGEEFCVLLPETDVDGATTVAQRICQAVRQPPVTVEGKQISVTTSCGISTVVPNEHLTPNDFLAQADNALYRAKKNGRNRYEIFTGIATSSQLQSL